MTDPARLAAGPLHGITVVALEHAVAAPFATRQLADLGARVIKIERPGRGDFARGYDETVHGQSSYFVWLNRGKESLVLDVKTAAGREVLDRLLGEADVFVHNLATGAAQRLGVDAASLGAQHPHVIMCEISGYGTTGPWADRKAYDLLVQAEAGLLSVTGTPEAACRVGVSIADIAAGMYAYSGILSALYERASGGPVRSVQVALFEALAEWMGAPAYYTRYGGSPPPRVTAEHATIAPYGPYATKDGDQILVAVQHEGEWLDLCTGVLGDPELAGDARFGSNASRVANRVALNERVAAGMARLTLAEAEAKLHAARIANGRLNSVDQFLHHPSLAARGRWTEVDAPGGRVATLLPPVDLAGVEPRLGPVPALGEHTDRILASLGYSPAVELLDARDA